MSLEKLLIFGFALAAATALAVLGEGSSEARVSETGGYRSGVETLLERIP